MKALLAAIQQERGLAAWLKSSLWRRGFDRGSLDRAEDYADPGLVETAHIGHLPGERVMYEANVHGSSGRPYLTRITFHSVRDTWMLRAECTCPVGLFCKHGAAVVLLALRTLLPRNIGEAVVAPANRLDPAVNTWLASLALATHSKSSKSASATPKKAATEKRFLAFCLEPLPHSPRPGWVFSMRVGQYRKDGSLEISDRNAQADPSRPPKYMTREDFIPASFYHQRFRKYSLWNEMRLEDGDWEDLLETANATGHFFMLRPRDHRWQPVILGPEETVEATWEILPNGNAKPVLRGGRTDLVVLPTQPQRYLDPETATLGTLNGHLPGTLLSLWSNAPEVPANQIPLLVERMDSLAPILPQPTTSELEQRPRTAPIPHLTIQSRRFFIDRDAEDWILGLVHFTYGDSPPLPACGDKCPPTHVELKDGKRILWHRDPAAEFAAEELLHELTLAPMELYFPASCLDATTRRAVVVDDPDPTDQLAWLRLHASGVFDRLREIGWVVNIEPSARLIIHDITDFFPEIENDPDHGINWFRFDVTSEVNGKRVSLIPHIAAAIENGVLNAMPFEEAGSPEPKNIGNDDDEWDDWDDEDEPYQDAMGREQPSTRLPEYFILPCDNPADGVIRFPANRFVEICRQVAHLFQGHGGGGGALRIDHLAAAAAADAFALASTETTRNLAELARRLKDITALPPAELPATVRADLRPYQLDGFRWLQFLARNHLHGVLADDMGLGKTLQTLAHLAAEHQSTPGRPSLVVAPTSVVPNWAAEAAKFTPHLKVLTLHGKDRGIYFDSIHAADVVLTSYPLLSRDLEIFEKQDWNTLVLDEAQYIKNPKSIVAQSACKLKAAHRICLSGTPMENHLGELWSLMRFLMPGFLGDEKFFNTHVRRPIERQKSKDAQLALNRRVSPLILRRTKDQVATELPEKTILIHHVDLTTRQTDLYESVRAAMDKRVRDAIAVQGLSKSHIIVLDALLKLRQICCHPQLLSIPAAAKVTESAKLTYLTDELLPTLIEENRRVLLFSSFTSMLERIELHLVEKGIRHLKLTGKTTDRASLVKEFQTGNIPIFLISLKAGGTGLNLTAADTVIHYDPWWNPAAENQATDRAHRIGQTKPVFVHKLVCRGTIEDRILELQQHKAALVEALLAEETTQLRIDSETLSHLLAPIQ